jgi:NAD(P)-dependent dehydrogenase (short-subunit alcohol dehydrogenase family)
MASYPELSGRNIVITGGANGIGEATVRAFHQQAARVLFCDTDAKAGERLAKELRGGAYFSKVDLTSERQITRWIHQIGSQWKRLDVLVNNAAIDPRIPLEESATEQWDRMFAINLRAYFLTCREAVKFMPTQGASIVNLASITFHGGPANMSAYVATKGGVLGFTRSLARELGPRHIRVNTVSPGWIMTERQVSKWLDAQGEEEIRRNQVLPDVNTLTRNAAKQAYEQADPVLLEPIMEVDVTVPDDTVGSVNGDLNSRRGRLQGMEPVAGMTRIKAEVPMAEMLTYGQALTSMTGGRGDYHMQFLRYDEVPSHVAQKLIEDSKKEQEEAKV